MPKVTVVIPCYNEEESFSKIFEKVIEVLKSYDYEIIVVDDGSKDKTPEILKSYGDQITTLILKSKNEGKGAAIATGLEAATGDLLIIQDADLEYNPNDYHRVFKPILEGKADVVYGSRFSSDASRQVVYLGHYMGNRVLTFLSNLLTGLRLTDMETCYKVFSKKIYKQLTITEKRFGIEPEITAKIAKLNCRVTEVGISYEGRSFQEGKKITWKDGISAIRCILKYNLFSS